MCLGVYIGSCRELPITAASAGEVDVFHVVKVESDEDEPFLHTVLDAPYVVRACAPPHGCGCGFGYEAPAVVRDTIDGIPSDVSAAIVRNYLARVQIVRDLRRYLRSAAGAADVRVWAMWCEPKPPRGSTEVSLSFFGGRSFGFESDWLYLVRGEGRSR